MYISYMVYVFIAIRNDLLGCVLGRNESMVIILKKLHKYSVSFSCDFYVPISSVHLYMF